MTTTLLSQNNTLHTVLDGGQRMMVMLAIITLPIRHLPVSLPLVGGDFMRLFIYAGLLLGLIDHYLFPRKYTTIEKQGLLFLAAVLFWGMICTVIGIMEYPYFSQIDLLQMDKFKNVYDTLLARTNTVSELAAMKVWLFIKAIRGSVFEIVNTYLMSLWVYSLYHDKSKALLKDFSIAVAFLVFIMSVYSVIEVGYLTGNVACKNLLVKINPMYMKIASDHGWWPPLLWKGQLRSLYLEPSYLGLTAAFLLPVLCSRIFKNLNFINLVLLNALILMIFLTKARTATLLLIGELGLFGLFLLLSSKESIIFKGCVIFLSTVLMFGASLSILSRYTSGNQGTQLEDIGVTEYVEENVISITGNKRSNSARFGNMHATLVTGLRHPLFGVGRGMQHMYIRDNLTEAERNVGEIRLWITKMEEKGPFKSGLPILNEFTGQIAQTGVVGLALFLLPIFYILKNFSKKKQFFADWNVISCFVAYIGVVVAMLPNAVTIPYFLMTGAMLVLLHDDKNERTGMENE